MAEARRSLCLASFPECPEEESEIQRWTLDKSSPLLHTVLSNNEILAKFELSMYLPAGKGGSKLAYTIRLTDASISSIRLVSDPDGNLHQVVSFTYRKIEWVWADGSITSEDDWGTPVAKKKK